MELIHLKLSVSSSSHAEDGCYDWNYFWDGRLPSAEEERKIKSGLRSFKDDTHQHQVYLLTLKDWVRWVQDVTAETELNWWVTGYSEGNGNGNGHENEMIPFMSFKLLNRVKVNAISVWSSFTTNMKNIENQLVFIASLDGNWMRTHSRWHLRLVICSTPHSIRNNKR